MKQLQDIQYSLHVFLLEVKLPYLAHKTLYVINTTRAGTLLLLSPKEWAEKRVAVLQRLLVTAHVRAEPQLLFSKKGLS